MTEEKNGKFDLDALLQPLGGFGKFQILNLLQVAVIISLASITELLYVFTAGEVPHRCLIAECEDLENATFHQPWLGDAIPLKSSGQFDSCLRYNKSDNGKCGNNSFTKETYLCEEFVYETEEWTIARESWGIHCDDDKWMLTLIGSLNNAGEVVGSLYVGFLSDRFGRKSVIVTMSIIVAIIGTIQSFSVNYIMFACLEFLETSMEGGLFTLPFVLEIVDPSKRVIVAGIVCCAYPLGEIIVGVVQWLTLDWRTLLRIVRIPFLLVVIFYWTMPESVRWLLAKGKRVEALKILKRVASTNGKTLDKNIEEMVLRHNEREKDDSIPDKNMEFKAMLSSKRMCLRFLATLFVWIANTVIFFGMNLNSVSINDNKFLNFILTSLIEVPAYIAVLLLLDRIGRRAVQSGSLFLCAVGVLLFAFVPSDWTWAQLLLYLIGKFGVAMSFVVIDVFTTELFPTSLRGTAISTGHMVGRIAAIVAPQTPLLSDIYKPMPLLIFSILAAIGGSLALSLPETLNTKLPDTVLEAEALGIKKQKKDSVIN